MTISPPRPPPLAWRDEASEVRDGSYVHAVDLAPGGAPERERHAIAVDGFVVDWQLRTAVAEEP